MPRIPARWHWHEIASIAETGYCRNCGAEDDTGDRVLCRDDAFRACSADCAAKIDAREGEEE